MYYPIVPQQIPQTRRSEVNEKILFCIDTNNNSLTNEIIFNCYTGLGGLHGLKQDDYDNYHDYSEAKKEVEIGQFFTPHNICRQMVELISPDPTEVVLDMCCGMGNFFNYLPNLYNAFGFDIDGQAVKVAKTLYPQANLEIRDIRQYDSTMSFDYLLGNPPFNLDFNGDSSQFFYLNKAFWVLKPGGIMLVIVPASFLQSEFWEKTKVSSINRDFSFIGQTLLPSDSFSSIGVQSFNTKVMAFMRYSDSITMRPYKAEEFISMDEMKSRINAAKEIRQKLRIQLMRELKNRGLVDERFEYKVKKYLYELKTHPHLKVHYPKALALVTKYHNQKPPSDCNSEEYKNWQYSKLTPAKILPILKRYIVNQYVVPRKEVALVKTGYSFKLKGYTPGMLRDIDKKRTSINDLIMNYDTLPLVPEMTPKLRGQYRQAEKYIARRRREYAQQNQPFSEMECDRKLVSYISKLTFNNKQGRPVKFTKLQRHDMNWIFQKRYALLNWQQGSGKTAVAYNFGKLQLLRKVVKNTIILAPPNAINMTWVPFMEVNHEKYQLITSPGQLADVQPGEFLLVPLSILAKLKRELKRFIKMRSRKLCLLFDESDEITNPSSIRTKLTLDIFRRLHTKLLDTGTTTRNNIGELYSQIELLYNNSVNMMCDCSYVYLENKDKEIVCRDITTTEYHRPFPPKGGNYLFKSCFCPAKASVFGIEKHNQDVYNQDDLFRLIDKTILTRKFRDFAGDKYTIHNHTVTPSESEKAVYLKIMEEFFSICYLYFSSTGDTRKESSLQIVRQIMLLIRSCSIPHLMPGYVGDEYPRKAKYIAGMIKNMPGKVAVGCTSIDSKNVYEEHIREQFPDRPLFIIQGDINFKKRINIIEEFQATKNGILISTQQSLKSSANIPLCNDVIIESLQWNIPNMEQYYFRFIRLDCEEHTHVHFVTYEDSIEQNLMALVLTKERLNEFIKTGEVKEESKIYEEFDISPDIIETLLHREKDDKGRFHISWGYQHVS